MDPGVQRVLDPDLVAMMFSLKSNHVRSCMLTMSVATALHSYNTCKVFLIIGTYVGMCLYIPFCMSLACFLGSSIRGLLPFGVRIMHVAVYTDLQLVTDQCLLYKCVQCLLSCVAVKA